MLKELLTATTIKNLADAKAYKLGEKHARAGAVNKVVQPDDDNLAGTVAVGEATRAARLMAEGERVRWACDCPAGKAGTFCEHSVALALVWTKAVVPAAKKKKKAAPTTAIGQLREFLETRSAEELVQLIMAQAASDRQLKDRLVLQIQMQQQSERFDGGAVELMLVKAIRAGGHIYARKVRLYSRRIDTIVDGIDSALKQGHGEAVARICEAGVRELDLALRTRIYDAGEGLASECQRRLAFLHFEACTAAPPNPDDLAGRLFDLNIGTTFGYFSDAPEVYLELLGEAGLNRLSERIEAAIEKEDSQYGLRGDAMRRRMAPLKESLLAARGLL